MSDSGSNMFFADKATRNDQFAFRNNDPNAMEQVIAGDNSARVHPFPEMQDQTQKVGMGDGEPAGPFNDPQPPRMAAARRNV